MKRWVLLMLLVAAVLVSACADSKDAEEPEEGYAVYFLEADLESASGKDALRAEMIDIEAADQLSTQELAGILVEKLLEGPTDITLTSVIPKGTKLLSVSVFGGRALVDLSMPYNMLSGVKLTLADCAIAMTLSQLPDVLTTSVTVHGQKLMYRDKQTVAAWDVLHATHEDVVSTLTATLYFPDENGVLQAERQELELYEGDTQAKMVANALKNGPGRSELLPVWPKAWEELSVWVKETTCYVNLPTALLTEEVSEADVRLVLEALGRSLCGLDTVAEVRFLVDGAFGQMYGPVDVSAAYIEAKNGA